MTEQAGKVIDLVLLQGQVSSGNYVTKINQSEYYRIVVLARPLPISKGKALGTRLSHVTITIFHFWGGEGSIFQNE